MRASKLITILFLGLIPKIANAQTNLLENGDFSEGPTVNVNGIATVQPHQRLITGWAVGRHSVDYITNYWQEPTGLTASIDLNGTGTGNQNGKLSQKFATTPGQTYAGSFYFSGNPYCGPSKKRMVLEVGPVNKSYTWNAAKQGNTLSDMKWQPKTFQFDADATTTTITFASQTLDGQCGPSIAGVSIIPAD